MVASEVKSLAVQTAKATEDISKLIGAVQASTGGAVAAIGRIAGRMQEIDGCTGAVSTAVQEQSAATTEISHNVASAADGARLVVSVLDECHRRRRRNPRGGRKRARRLAGGGIGRRRTAPGDRGFPYPGGGLTARFSPPQNWISSHLMHRRAGSASLPPGQRVRTGDNNAAGLLHHAGAPE